MKFALTSNKLRLDFTNLRAFTNYIRTYSTTSYQLRLNFVQTMPELHAKFTMTTLRMET